MQRHTTLAGEARTGSILDYKWSGHGEIVVSVLGYEPPDLNSILRGLGRACSVICDNLYVREYYGMLLCSDESA